MYQISVYGRMDIRYACASTSIPQSAFAYVDLIRVRFYLRTQKEINDLNGVSELCKCIFFSMPELLLIKKYVQISFQHKEEIQIVWKCKCFSLSTNADIFEIYEH